MLLLVEFGDRDECYAAFVSLCGFFPSINNNEQSELTNASPEAISITTRKPDTNDSEIACCIAAYVELLSPVGIDIPTSLFCCATMLLCVSTGICNGAR